MAYRQSGWSAFTKKTDPPKKKDGITPILVETAVLSKAQKGRQEPTWEGTDEYRKPEDIPASEYIERGLNPADYIPGYKKEKKDVQIPKKDKKK